MSKATPRPRVTGSTDSHRSRVYATECTVQREDGSFCDSPSIPGAPASVCAKHAARLYLFMREYVAGSKRIDLLSKLIHASEQSQRDLYRQTPYQPNEVVYYVRVGDHIKIGYTADLRTRMSAYPTGKLLATERGSMTLENRRHREFAHALDAGREWFRITPDLMAHIKDLAHVA